MEQRTDEWYQARLGKITSSNVGKLMGKTLTKTATSYLNQLVGERLITEDYKTTMFDLWQHRNNVSSFATHWGEMYEPIAFDKYVEAMGDKWIYTAYAGGFTEHHTIEGWADSPDGIVYDENLSKVGTIEIKCPYSVANTINYISTIRGAETTAEGLKQANSDYYWQVVSHCVCNGVNWCDFIIFDPMLTTGVTVFRICPNEADKDALTARVKESLDYIEQTIKTIKQC